MMSLVSESGGLAAWPWAQKKCLGLTGAAVPPAPLTTSPANGSAAATAAASERDDGMASGLPRSTAGIPVRPGVGLSPPARPVKTSATTDKGVNGPPVDPRSGAGPHEHRRRDDGQQRRGQENARRQPRSLGAGELGG